MEYKSKLFLANRNALVISQISQIIFSRFQSLVSFKQWRPGSYMFWFRVCWCWTLLRFGCSCYNVL